MIKNLLIFFIFILFVDLLTETLEHGIIAYDVEFADTILILGLIFHVIEEFGGKIFFLLLKADIQESVVGGYVGVFILLFKLFHNVKRIYIGIPSQIIFELDV